MGHTVSLLKANHISIMAARITSVDNSVDSGIWANPEHRAYGQTNVFIIIPELIKMLEKGQYKTGAIVKDYKYVELTWKGVDYYVWKTR